MVPDGRLPSDFTPRENGNGLNDGSSKCRLHGALVNARIRLTYLTKSGGNKSVVGLAYFLTCALLLWIGTQIPSTVSLLAQGTIDVTTATNGHMGMTWPMSMGRIETADGPTLAYGVMVYQRQGYEVNTTLAQFTRMFDALYDEHNT